MRYLRESVDGATHIAIYRDSPRSRKVLDGYLYPLSVNSRKMINGVMVPLPDALPANFPAGKSKSKIKGSLSLYCWHLISHVVLH